MYSYKKKYVVDPFIISPGVTPKTKYDAKCNFLSSLGNFGEIPQEVCYKDVISIIIAGKSMYECRMNERMQKFKQIGKKLLTNYLCNYPFNTFEINKTRITVTTTVIKLNHSNLRPYFFSSDFQKMY